MKLGIEEKIQNINKDDLLKILLLSGFTIFFAKLIVTGEIYDYVHPRIITFVYLAIAGLIFMIIGLIRKIKLAVKSKVQIKNYIVLILALSLIVYMEGSKVNSNISSESYPIASESINSTNSDNDFNTTNNKSLQNINTGSSNNVKLEEVDGVIIIERDNYVSSLDEIMNNPEKYNGRKVEISGFVYKDSSAGSNEFILARYMMVCCAADLQIAGIKCREDSENKIDIDTWVRVNGTITNVDDEAVIDAESIEIDEKPDKQYVYPF